jgi:N6-adenosine-specific RNA methylase IME4
VIDQARGEHSAKPEAVLELIETYFPSLPKIGLNRRGPPRPGWAAWSNEMARTI